MLVLVAHRIAGFDASLIACMLGLSTLKQAASWKTAQAFWMIGCICECAFGPPHIMLSRMSASNILGTFFCASFPELVRNLPRMLASERAVKAGEKTYAFDQDAGARTHDSLSPQEHATMDMFERATVRYSAIEKKFLKD